MLMIIGVTPIEKKELAAYELKGANHVTPRKPNLENHLIRPWNTSRTVLALVVDSQRPPGSDVRPRVVVDMQRAPGSDVRPRVVVLTTNPGCTRGSPPQNQLRKTSKCRPMVRPRAMALVRGSEPLDNLSLKQVHG
uniref:Uncharacterized protein n=1 Tax=Solanum tuberosum TaxID=4113 RepID=M1DLG4_SOLTU